MLRHWQPQQRSAVPVSPDGGPNWRPPCARCGAHSLEHTQHALLHICSDEQRVREAQGALQPCNMQYESTMN